MSKSNHHLLIVDDEPHILHVLCRLFSTEGYQVSVALTVQEALIILEHEPIDIIISDMRMPDLNGIDLFEISLKQWPEVKRILLTGYADLNDAISAINNGKIDYYIAKPWKNEQFKSAIRYAVETLPPASLDELKHTNLLGLVTIIDNQLDCLLKEQQEQTLRNEFASIVSHELRTPLTSIYSSLAMIQFCAVRQFSGDIKKLIDIAYKNCEYMMLLINDILDTEKIASGKMYFNIKKQNLKSIIERAITQMGAYSKTYNVKINRKKIASNIMVHVDNGRLLQVLVNLLSNAIKFSPDNSEIELFPQISNGKIRICIRDQGPGVPKKFYSKIFKKFSKIDSNTRKIGSGLGLYISKQIIEEMGGTIGFNTEIGTGTVFWFELDYEPRAQPTN